MKVGSQRKKRRRHGKNKIRNICKCIIFVCTVFIVICVGSKWISSVKNTVPKDQGLVQELNEIAEYYSSQLKETKNKTATDESRDISEQYEEKAEETSQLAEIVEEGNNADDVEAAGQKTEGRERYLRELIDSAPLTPGYPEGPELKNLLDTLMPEITEGCQDTYDQVKACYDYLVNSCSFSNTEKYTYEQDAYILLTEFRGSCTYYAAAFHFMMRYIGLEDQLISGYRYLESGRSFHRWNEIIIDNVPYVFDTQWEDTLSRNSGGISYVRFCMTHEEVKEWYEF